MVDEDEEQESDPVTMRTLAEEEVTLVRNRRTKTKSSLLTPKQRDYLLDRSDIEPKSAEERAIRNRIRERLKIAIFDMGIVGDNIEQRDLERAFNEPDLFNQLHKQLALILLGASLAGKYELPDNGTTDDLVAMYEDLYEDGLKTLHEQRGLYVENASVSIDIELGPSTDQLKENDYAEMSIDHLTLLLQNGEVTREEFAEIMNERSDFQTLQDTAENEE